MRIELRGKLVQIGVRAGFQLLAQLPDCGAGCGKCVQGRLFLRLRVGQRLLQRICACFQHADFLLVGSLVLAGKHLTKLGDPRGKGMLRLQHADLLVRLVPCVLRSAQRILCFWNLLVQIFFAADVLSRCFDLRVQFADLCFSDLQLLLRGGFCLLFGKTWQQRFQSPAQSVCLFFHFCFLRCGAFACGGSGGLRIVICGFCAFYLFLCGSVLRQHRRARVLHGAADRAGDSGLQAACKNARLRVQKCPLHPGVCLKLLGCRLCQREIRRLFFCSVFCSVCRFL